MYVIKFNLLLTLHLKCVAVRYGFRFNTFHGGVKPVLLSSVNRVCLRACVRASRSKFAKCLRMCNI